MFDEFTTGLSVANSDYFVLKAIEKLQGRPCTQADIIEASEIKCGRTTLWRSLSRLQKLKKIAIESRSHYGCIYVIQENKLETA